MNTKNVDISIMHPCVRKTGFKVDGQLKPITHNKQDHKIHPPLTIAIHQPNFMPWLGFFFKILKSDHFVLLDDVQFSKRSYINRVRIKCQNGIQWLTVPVKTKGQYYQTIRDTMIVTQNAWKRKIIGNLAACYARTPFFSTYLPEIEGVIHNAHTHIVDLNCELIAFFVKALKLTTNMIKSSELDHIDGNATKRLISICQALKCQKYLSGFGGSRYQDVELFNAAGIEIDIYNFMHPVYPQLWNQFVPGLSIVDLLFNCGPDSLSVLKRGMGLE